MTDDDVIDLIEPSTIDEARLQLVKALHTAVHGDVWARPESPREVWRMLLAEVREWRTEHEGQKNLVELVDRVVRLINLDYVPAVIEHLTVVVNSHNERCPDSRLDDALDDLLSAVALVRDHLDEEH